MNRILNWLERLFAGVQRARFTGYGGAPTQLQARLASSLDGAYFRAEVQIFPPRGGSRATATAAEIAIRQTIQNAVRHFSVLHLDEARSAVNLALDALPDNAPMAICRLWSEPEGEEYTRKHEQLRLEAQLERAEQQAQLDRLAFISHEILPYPNLARAWWLRDDPARLMDLVQNAAMFEETARIFATAPGSAPEDPIPGLLRDFLTGLRPEHRDLLIRQMREVFLGYERPDLADLVDPLLAPAPSSTSPGPNGHPRPDAGSTPDGSGGG